MRIALLSAARVGQSYIHNCHSFGIPVPLQLTLYRASAHNICLHQIERIRLDLL